jgi:hypothetical protein
MFITLTCPDCKRARVYNSRGKCNCGSYHIYTPAIAIGHKIWVPTDEAKIWLWPDAESPIAWFRDIRDTRPGRMEIFPAGPWVRTRAI